MAYQVRELFEKHNIADTALRTILVPPPVLSYGVCQRPPSVETEQTLHEIQVFIRTLVSEIATPLVEAQAVVPFFVVSAVLDAMHRISITPPHAFFLSLFLRTAIRQGRLCENVLVDGEPAAILTRLCNDIAGAEQYGVVLYNQALALECFVNLLYRADTGHRGKGHCSSPLDLDVMDVLCATRHSRDELFAAVGKALDAVADALCAELRDETLTMNATGGPSWATVECDRTREANSAVTSAMGRNVRGYLLYLHARMTLCKDKFATGDESASCRDGVDKDVYITTRCPMRMVVSTPRETSTAEPDGSGVCASEQKEAAMPAAPNDNDSRSSSSSSSSSRSGDVYLQFRGDVRWVRVPRAVVDRLWPEHAGLLTNNRPPITSVLSYATTTSLLAVDNAPATPRR